MVPAPDPAGGYGWPLDGTPVITRPFQLPPEPWLPGHRGVDLGARPGAQVLAAGAGTVAFAGRVAGVGVVSVEHANGLRTTYEPVTALVRAGQAVARGQVIGLLDAGHPGCPVPACLHWGLRRGGIYLDPLILLRAGHVRLLPLTASRSGAWMSLPVRTAQPLDRHVRVYLRAGQRRVAQQLLYRTQIRPTLQQMRGRRVPQAVR
jgi:murein DD-endopeptidase MepM/ murein hydrolase activator NlpD